MINLKKLLKIFYYLIVLLIPKNNFGDKVFSLINFVRWHRRIPNNPKLFNDYLYKIKNSREGHNKLREYVTDKEFVKKYIKLKIGNKYNVPTFKIIKDYKQVKNYIFPGKCCIKPTHLSGEYILRKKNEDIDYSILKKWFNSNYYNLGREKNYRYLKPKIIIEPLIFNSIDNMDYKFFCFKSKVKFIQVDIDRNYNHSRNYYDRSWKKLNFSILKPKSKKKIKKPKNFKKMLELAELLSKDFEFIRIDLYSNNKKIFIGEVTNWPENGNGYFIPRYAEIKASKLLFN